MRSTPPPDERDIEISALPSAVRRSAGVLALVALVVGVATYAALLLVPSRYQSEAQLRVGASPDSAALSVDREAIASRVQELRSPDLAKKLAAELKLDLRPEFNSAIDASSFLARLSRLTGIGGPRPGESGEERVLAAYFRALEVYQVKDTRVITLGFTALDSELAATAANRLIELYQEWLRQRGVTETTDANAWLIPEIDKRTGELAAAEAEVERFRSTANLFRGGNTSQSSGLAEQQLADQTSELTRVRAQRSEVEARAQAARELMGRGVPDAIPDVQKSPVIQGLITERVRAERDLAEAATQLLPAHPRMRQLNANVADIRRQVQREASTVVEGLEREVKALALREKLLQRTLDEAKTGLGNKAGDRVRLAQLEDEAKAKRRELEALRERYEASRSRGSTKAVPVEIQVIATARPSSRPSAPKREQISALAAAATFALGLVAVLLRELLAANGSRVARPGTHRRRHLQQGSTPGFQAAPLGEPTQPRAGAPSRPMATPVVQRGNGARGDSDTGSGNLPMVSQVVERLLANSGGQGGYRTLVVGGTAGADVREQAIAIAGGLSVAGRHVVLVDWSLVGEGLSGLLGLPAAPGFAELIAGSASFEEVIRTLPGSGVHLLPCGASARIEAADLDADRLNLLLDVLDETYSDVVITGSHDAIRDLFLAIEGRVDAGIAIEMTAAGEAWLDAASPNRFLGFEVTEIDIMHVALTPQSVAKPSGHSRRGLRSMGGRQLTGAVS